MTMKQNVWIPFRVQGVEMGQVKHVNEKLIVNRRIDIPGVGYLVREDLPSTNEYYVISLNSKYTGKSDVTLFFDKDPFETLFNSQFTRIVDYFVHASNMIKLFNEEEGSSKKDYENEPHGNFEFCHFFVSDEGEVDNLKLYFWIQKSK